MQNLHFRHLESPLEQRDGLQSLSTYENDVYGFKISYKNEYLIKLSNVNSALKTYFGGPKMLQQFLAFFVILREWCMFRSRRFNDVDFQRASRGIVVACVEIIKGGG